MSTVSKRLAWKEAALLRPICLSCLVLLAMLLFLGAWVTNRSVDYTRFVENMTMMLGGIVGLASGIILFVFERESGTDRFLEGFPVDGRQVARVKLFQAAIYFFVYLIGGVLIAAVALGLYQGGMPRIEGKGMPVASSILLAIVALECFLWALVCSLLMKSSLQATIVSAFLSVASVIGIGLIMSAFTNEQRDMWATVGANGCLCAMLAAGVWLMSPGWLRGQSRGKKKGASASLVAGMNPASGRVKCAYPFKALLWQSVRRCWIPWLMIAGFLLAEGYLWGGALVMATSQPFNYYSGSDEISFLSLIAQWWSLAFVGAGAATGMLAFFQDQGRAQYLFFQQRADYPRRVWLSRVLIIASMLPVVWVSAEMASRFLSSMMASGNWDPYGEVEQLLFQWWPLIFLISFLGGAGIAQLVTMAIRMSSGFVAVIVTVVLSLCLASWCRSLIILQGSFLVFVLPIAVACFAATWWLAPRWISGRLVKTSSVLAFGCCALVVAGTIGGWIFHRTTQYSVPQEAEAWVAFYEDTQAIDNDPQKYAAAIKMRDAMRKLDLPTEGEFRAPPEKWTAAMLDEVAAANGEAIDAIRQTLDEPRCDLFLNPRSSKERTGQAMQIARGLELATRQQIRNGDPGQALSCLVDELKATWKLSTNDWMCKQVLRRMVDCASRKGVEESDIRDAIGGLEDVLEDVFSSEGEELLYREGVFQVQRTYGQTDAQESVRFKEGRSPWNWELERARRRSLCEIQYGGTDWHWFTRANDDSGLSAAWMRHDAAKSEIVAQRIRLTRLMHEFRYAQVRLALTAWKLKHGDYPKTLDELRGPFFETVPCSVYTGRQFAYSGQGLDASVFFVPESVVRGGHESWREAYSQYESSLPTSEYWIEAGQPFLLPWSGVAAGKKAFLRQEASVEGEPMLVPSNTPESAYWIPSGWAYQNQMSGVEEFLLDVGLEPAVSE